MIETAVSPSLRPSWQARHTLPGLLEDIDFLLFDELLRQQKSAGTAGDLLEIGAFMGRSAVVIGPHAQPEEKFFICDVFEDSTSDAANDAENAESYVGLTRRTFEANYSRFVAHPPTIIQELSTHIRQHIPDASLRFAHIDGGHMYDVVKADIDNVQHLMKKQGVVVCDDFRAPHTPGVAAAVWESVSNGTLMPICITDTKFYGSPTPETAVAVQDGLRSWLSQFGEVSMGEQSVQGLNVIVIANVHIWTTRRRLKAVLPPILTDKLLSRQKAHRGV